MRNNFFLSSHLDDNYMYHTWLFILSNIGPRLTQYTFVFIHILFEVVGSSPAIEWSKLDDFFCKLIRQSTITTIMI